MTESSLSPIDDKPKLRPCCSERSLLRVGRMPQLFALLMVTKKTCTLVVDLNQNAAVSEESFLLSMQKSTKFQKVTRERVPTGGYSSPRYLGGVCCNGEGKKETFSSIVLSQKISSVLFSSERGAGASSAAHCEVAFDVIDL